MDVKDLKEIVIEIGQYIDNHNGCPLSTIRKSYGHKGKNMDEIMNAIFNIKCFKLDDFDGHSIIFKPHLKNSWHEYIDEYFDNIMHQQAVEKISEENLKLSNKAFKRDNVVYWINLVISFATLIICIWTLIMQFYHLK